MTQQRTIVLATPHRRYDNLEAVLRERHALDVRRIRAPAELTLPTLEEIAPTHVFFPHWSWKIPEGIFRRHECVVFHMTDLPFGRGGSPLQNLIVRGIERTQLSALRCVAELDAGPIYLKRELSTLGTAEEVFLRAASLMEGMIVEIASGSVQAAPQTGEVVLFTRRSPSDSDLMRADSLSEAFDLIRMLDAEGYPNAFAQIGDWRFEFTRASLRPDAVIADVRITRVAVAAKKEST